MLILTVLLMLGFPVGNDDKQVRDKEHVIYDSVPASDRESLRHVLEKAISSRKAGRWEEMYHLFDNERHITKEQFVERMKKMDRLVEFVPSKITFIPPMGLWQVDGCGLFDPPPHGKTGGVASSLYARRTTEGWRLSDVSVQVLKDEPEGMRDCSIQSPQPSLPDP